MNNKKITKSQILILGSFLITFSIILLTFNYFLKLKEEVYADFSLKSNYTYKESIAGLPFLNNLTKEDVAKEIAPPPVPKKIDYSVYKGVLEIPRIGLKRGFYDENHKRNNILYNVTLISGSSMPDVTNGNLMLMAHSGDAYISFFAYLYKVNPGDYVYVTYNNVKYSYKIVNKYNVSKTGFVDISRNPNKTTITLITCTKDNDHEQTIYIGELE